MQKSKIEKEIIHLNSNELNSNYEETLKWMDERIECVKTCIKFAKKEVDKIKVNFFVCDVRMKEEVFYSLQKVKEELKCSKEQLKILNKIKNDYKR